MHNGSPFLKRFSYSLLIIVGAFVLILCVGGASCYHLYQQRFSQEREMGGHLARQAGQALTLWLNDQVLIAKSLANTAAVREACLTPESASIRETAALFLRSIHKEHPEYTLITIVPFFKNPEAMVAVQTNGAVRSVRHATSLVDSVQGLSVGVGGLNFGYIKAIHDGLPAYIGEAKPNSVAGLPPLFMIAVPIHSQEGSLLGTLTFGVKLKYFSKFFSDNVTVGKTGRVEIIDARGLYISNKDRSKILSTAERDITKPLLEHLHKGDKQFTCTHGGITWEYTAQHINTPHAMAASWWLLFQRDRAELHEALLPPLLGFVSLCLVVFVIITFLAVKANKALLRSLRERALRKQTDSHRLYTRCIPYGVALMDGNLCFTDVNPAIMALLGYDESELLGQALERFLMGRSNMTRIFDMVLASREQGSAANVPFRHKDGSSLVFDVLVSPLPQEGGLQCTVLTLMPIPEKYDFEERMRALYRVSLDSYFSFDEHGMLVDCGESSVDFLHAHNKDEILKNFSDFSPHLQPDGHESSALRQKMLQQALEEGFVRFEWTHQSFEGELIPCEINLVRFVQKGRPAILGCVRDLREQKKIEATLAKERALLRAIIDNIQGIIFLRDAEGRYVIVNRQYTLVTGLTAEQVFGKTDDDLLPPDLAAICRKTDAAARESLDPYYFEQKLVLPNGTERDYMFSKEAFHSTKGDLEGILSTGIDITLMKEAERQIIIAKIKAEDASRAKSDFLARMSHEIRTPMNAIMGMSYLCLQTGLTAQQENYLTKIKNAATNLMSILNSILDFSKIESGKMSSEEVPFVFGNVLEQVESLLSEKAESQGIQLHIDCDDAVPQQLEGDPLHLSQVLINLTANAIKFTSDGNVSIRAFIDSVIDDRVRLHVCVADTGIGISPSQLEHLFEPFAQANGSTTRLYGGTGLGLAICKSLVELMNGKIWAESVVGQGSVFHVTLWLKKVFQVLPDNALPDKALEDGQGTVTPKDALLHGSRHDMTESSAGSGDFESHGVQSQALVPLQIQSQAQPQSQRTQYENRRVLLVEDNEINKEIGLELLKLSGINADVVSNGQEAVQAVAHHSYDLIFMDIQMPVMNGLEATQHIRASGTPQAGTVPIVAMTANAMESDREKSFEAGMNDHINKPIDVSRLEEILERWLGHHNA